MSSRKTVSLVLGSGSSRGWAHIGVIEALEEENIPIDYIVGCSIGAYVGALYASGSLEKLKEFVISMDGKKIFSYSDLIFPRLGLLDGRKRLKELFSMHTDAKDFSDLKIPVMMLATDLEEGDKVVLKSGDIIDALRATMSMPGLFPPARVNDRWLVDGGLVDPVPVSVARAMGSDVVIAVDLNSGLVPRKKRAVQKDNNLVTDYGIENGHADNSLNYIEKAALSLKNKKDELLGSKSSKFNILETVVTSISIMQERITRINLAVDPPDILIQPRIGKLKMLDFDKVEYAIEEGYIGLMEKIEDIKMLLEPV
ncbi:MAG: patatin-like phospholipase family protein [Proteobacteria bacterium]|nr:patatin-like phospholipase family protein [Pseudomonadota bacterium]